MACGFKLYYGIFLARKKTLTQLTEQTLQTDFVAGLEEHDLYFAPDFSFM